MAGSKMVVLFGFVFSLLIAFAGKALRKREWLITNPKLMLWVI